MQTIRRAFISAVRQLSYCLSAASSKLQNLAESLNKSSQLFIELDTEAPDKSPLFNERSTQIIKDEEKILNSNIDDQFNFDPDFYLAENSDVRAAGVDPFAHYISDGKREGRAPNSATARLSYTMDLKNLCEISKLEKKIIIQDAQFFVSIITPTFNTDPDFLDQLKFTILNQVYDNWEWLVVDDGSTNLETKKYLSKLKSVDPRIVVILNDKNLGISAASNIALNSSRGTHIALVDHDDLLSRIAISSIYEYWKINKFFDMYYTDECKLLPNGDLGWFWGKPDWSPAYLENTMYIGHLVVYRRDFINNLNGFRSQFDGTQDYDLALRAASTNPQVCHVPVFAYIWRAFEGSAALDVNEKHYTLDLQKRAVLDYASTVTPYALVREGDAPGYWRLVYPSPREIPLLTYVVYEGNYHYSGTTEGDHAASCIRAVMEAEFYSNFRFIVLGGEQSEQRGRFLRGIANKQVELVRHENFERSIYGTINQVAMRDGKDMLCIMDQNVHVVTKRGAEEIVSYMYNNPHVGSISPLFLQKNERIWRNGTIILSSGPARSGADQHRLFGGPNNLLRCRRETVAGGEGFLFISRKNFRSLNGFDLSLPQFSCEFDFSMRLRKAGFSCLVDPAVEVSRRVDCDADALDDAIDIKLSEFRFDNTDPYFSKWYDQNRTDFRINLNQYSV